MPHYLHADFEIELPRPFLVEGEGLGDLQGDWKIPGEMAIQEFALSNFSCRVEFVQRESGPSWWSSDRGGVFAVTKVRLRITREERDHPPETLKSGDAIDFSLRANYFGERIADYVKTAKEVTDRIIKVSRYRLGMYGARDVSDVVSTSFDNPKWFFDDEGPIDPGLRTISLRMDVPLQIESWGVSVLPRSASSTTIFVFHEVPEVPLHRELQALGKDAALSGDLRRAVVELAIACEVAVKQAFFAPDSAAFEAFEFLEEKQKVEVTVIELLRQPAERAFGAKFADVDATAHGQLEDLFRCRNKVAHRGRLVYRDSKGHLRSAGDDSVRAWWEGTEKLLNWLETKCGLAGIRGL